MWARVQGMALLYGTFCMVAAPLLLDAASTPTLNHYSDYGVVEQSSSANNGKLSIGNDPFGYSDEYTDNESGLQYLQVRYYDPVIMRFIAMDTYPLLNRYAYANENPIMNDDPSGHTAESSNINRGSLDAKVASIGIGLLGGFIIGLLGTACGGVGIIASTIIDAFSGAAISATQTATQEFSDNHKISAPSVAESAGIGGGLALIASIISSNSIKAFTNKNLSNDEEDLITNKSDENIKNKDLIANKSDENINIKDKIKNHIYSFLPNKKPENDFFADMLIYSIDNDEERENFKKAYRKLDSSIEKRIREWNQFHSTLTIQLQ